MDVLALGGGEREDPAVDGAQVRHLGRRDLDPGLDGRPGAPQDVCRRNEALARHTIGEDAGAAQSVAVHHSDSGAEASGHEGGFVAAGAATDNND